MEASALAAIEKSRNLVSERLANLQSSIYSLCQESGAYERCPYVKECRDKCESCPIPKSASEERRNG